MEGPSTPRLCGTPRLCSIPILLGVALLLLMFKGTQALNARRDDVAVEQDLGGDIAVEPVEEEEMGAEVAVGGKVFSGSTQAGEATPQDPVGPEEDHDQFYHPQDDGGEDSGPQPPLMLALEVQSGPEEDRDHLYHS